MSSFDNLAFIQHEVASWSGVTVTPHRFGGIEFTLGSRELGHLQPDGMLSIPFNDSLKGQLVAEGKAFAHTLYPNSGWVAFEICNQTAGYHGLWLLKLALEYNRIRQHRQSQTLTDSLRAEIRAKLGDLQLSLALLALFEALMKG